MCSSSPTCSGSPATTDRERLRWAVRYGDDLVGLRIADRLAILDVLDDAPAGLSELRGVLASEHRWRIRHRMV